MVQTEPLKEYAFAKGSCIIQATLSPTCVQPIHACLVWFRRHQEVPLNLFQKALRSFGSSASGYSIGPASHETTLVVVAQQQRLLPLLDNMYYVQMSSYPSSVEMNLFFDSGGPTRGGLLLDFGLN